MAITKQTVFKHFDIDCENWFISLGFVQVIKEDGVEIARSGTMRSAFVPGEINKVKSFTGLGDANKHIQYLNNLWTAQVIADYQATLS